MFKASKGRNIAIFYIIYPVSSHYFINNTNLFTRKEDGRSGHATLEVVHGWFSQHFRRRNEINQIVDQLEGKTDVSAILEGQL
jgi:hypothetical protein